MNYAKIQDNLECGGLTPLWISNAAEATNAFWRSELKAVSSHRTPNFSRCIRSLHWSLRFGAYLELGAWNLELTA